MTDKEIKDLWNKSKSETRNESHIFAQTLEALLQATNDFAAYMEESNIDIKGTDTSSLIATFADVFDAVHGILGSDILYSDVSPLYSDVECPCGSASLSYWDTTLDERERVIVQFQCDECNRILNVEYRVVSITEEINNDDDDGVEEEIAEEDDDGVEKEVI